VGRRAEAPDPNAARPQGSAAGTGRVIAHIVAGREPEIDIQGFTMARE
jgi:glycine/D-amino acid oxidase-like deaminating enzyme